MSANSVNSFLYHTGTGTAMADTTTTSCSTWYSVYPWVPNYWYEYRQDKATVAFRVVKKLIDLKVINEDKLTIKKFIHLVDELVNTL